MLPDQLFYNTGIFTYVWLLTNNKPASHKGRVMLIDAREQYEKEPKSFGNKRNRLTDEHRQWIEERYHEGWKPDFSDEHIKIFKTTNFAYHKVRVVFWQTDESDQPACITEPFTKSLTPANVKKVQEFYESDLEFRFTIKSEEAQWEIGFTLKPRENFAKKFGAEVNRVFAGEIKKLAKGIKDWDERSDHIKTFFADLNVQTAFTHRHYVEDFEYIPHGEDIEDFLKHEIGKPIIRWKDGNQLGYEILPNKYFYRYQPPKPADEVLEEFWKLEKEAESMLEGLR